MTMGEGNPTVMDVGHRVVGLQMTKKEAAAMTSRVKSKKRQASAPMPKRCMAAISMRKEPGMFISPRSR